MKEYLNFCTWFLQASYIMDTSIKCPRYFIAKIKNFPVTVDDNAIYQLYFSVELIPKIIFILDS
jgi:hypothetical protein